MSVHVSIKIARDEWRYTITNITPERGDEQVNCYSVVRALVGTDWDVMAMLMHTPSEGAPWLVKKALDLLPIGRHAQHAAEPVTVDVSARSEG
jgi:hypothetical protein